MEIKKISDNIWQIQKHGTMKVPAIIIASEKILEGIKQDKTIEQIQNVASLKGILKHAIALPDSHQGYGFNIGGVAAFDMEKGIISPGGVGYDINCSVRLLRTNLKIDDFLKKRKEIIEQIYKEVPSGVGSKGQLRVTKEMLHEVLKHGAKWAVKEGYGIKEDYEKTEENGCMPEADSNTVSQKALERGKPQLGSLGAGNHFLEFQKIEAIYDKDVAKAFGIENSDCLTFMVHCGSRGLGHQVASDYIKLMEDKYGFADLPDRELINAPINSELGQKYYKAMSCAANFAFANKQMITHWIREGFNKVFGDVKIDVVYDLCHNIAKFEEHMIDGEKMKVCVHRKGAARSFGPGRKEIPEIYRSVGQPVIIPGSMGTSSYLLVGTKKAEELTFGSTAHGAGRLCSRSAALRNINGEHVRNELSKRGIEVKAGSWKSIAEEAPEVYKDIDEVIRVSDEVGIGKRVIKFVPLGVIKG